MYQYSYQSISCSVLFKRGRSTLHRGQAQTSHPHDARLTGSPPLHVLLPCIYMSESNASAVAVLTQVLGELARVTSHYSPQQKYTLRGRRSTSTESCNSMAHCSLDALDRITYFFRLACGSALLALHLTRSGDALTSFMKCLTKKTRQQDCLESVRKRPVVSSEVQRSRYWAEVCQVL